MDDVILIDSPDVLRRIAEHLTAAADEFLPVRFAVDDGGLKYAVGRYTWTPPLGQKAD